MKIGFIGVGNIGAPIAGQLLAAGHRLLVHDIRRAAADALLASGAEWSEAPGSLAAQCEVVATCLPGIASTVSLISRISLAATTNASLRINIGVVPA